MTKRISEAPISGIAKGAAAGAQAIGRALGSKAAGATTAGAINKLSQGAAVGKNVLGAVAPYAEIIGEILADPRYRALFMKLINTIKADKARLQAKQPQAQQESISMKKINENEFGSEDAVDTVTLDVPLLIRMMEYAKEDAADDMDLHDVAEMMISLSKENDVLTMDQYDAIVGAADNAEGGPEPGAPEPVRESISYGYSQPQPESVQSLNYNATKRVGDSTVNISIQSNDMEELHRLIKLAGIENINSQEAPPPVATVTPNQYMPGAELEFRLERAMGESLEESTGLTYITFVKNKGDWEAFADDIRRVARLHDISFMDDSSDTVMKFIFNTPDDVDTVMALLDKSDYIEEANMMRENEFEDDDVEEGPMFVVIVEDGEVFIGEISKYEGKGKWYEDAVAGTEPANWGGKTYMSYLTHKEIMGWLHKDYDDVNGPFKSAQEASQFALNQYGWDEDAEHSSNSFDDEQNESVDLRYSTNSARITESLKKKMRKVLK